MQGEQSAQYALKIYPLYGQERLTLPFIELVG